MKLKGGSILYSLNGRHILETYDNLRENSRMCGEMKNSMAWWNPSTGEGRVTPAISAHLAAFISNVMKDNSRVPAVMSMTPLSKTWKDMDEKDDKTGFWYNRGQLANRVTTIKVGENIRTVGIPQNSTMSKGGWGRPHQIIKAAMVASALEFGFMNKNTYVAGRPLFKHATEYFIQKFFPAWHKVIGNSIRNTYVKIINDRRKGAVTSIERVTKADMTIAMSENTLRSMNPESDPAFNYSDDMIISEMSGGASFRAERSSEYYKNEIVQETAKEIKRSMSNQDAEEALKWFRDNPDWNK